MICYEDKVIVALTFDPLKSSLTSRRVKAIKLEMSLSQKLNSNTTFNAKKGYVDLKLKNVQKIGVFFKGFYHSEKKTISC